MSYDVQVPSLMILYEEYWSVIYARKEGGRPGSVLSGLSNSFPQSRLSAPHRFSSSGHFLRPFERPRGDSNDCEI